jgi:hypothetical protein
MASTHLIGAERAPQGVVTALRNASRATGVDFGYLLAKARQESAFRTDAQAATSSARGLFQFIDQTWLEMIASHGAAHGLAAEAAGVSRRPDGRLEVADPAARRAILSLRDDAGVSALMAAEYARDNRAVLEARLGRAVDSTELYLAHFLGPDGAGRFLEALDRSPATAAATVLPKAAAANPGVFYRRGAARSLAEVRDLMAAKMEGTAAPATHVAAADRPRPVVHPLSVAAGAGSFAAAPAAAGGHLSLWVVLTLSALPAPGEA